MYTENKIASVSYHPQNFPRNLNRIMDFSPTTTSRTDRTGYKKLRRSLKIRIHRTHPSRLVFPGGRDLWSIILWWRMAHIGAL